jgi:CRISPR/Cas system CSM-associated protein Csm3 (group 7 of RAMP superfamily)
MLLLKCLLIIQALPENALEEAAEDLEGISRFYADRLPQVNLPVVPASSIKGKLRSTQIRPPIVLEP